jgi:hypothetical protein
MCINLQKFATNNFTAKTGSGPSKTSAIAAIAWERNEYSGIKHVKTVVNELNAIVDRYTDVGWNDGDTVMQEVIAEVEQHDHLVNYINTMLMIPEFIEDTGEVSGAW